MATRILLPPSRHIDVVLIYIGGALLVISMLRKEITAAQAQNWVVKRSYKPSPTANVFS